METITNLNEMKTADFIEYVNKHPEIDFSKEVKKHLNETLMENQIYISPWDSAFIGDNCMISKKIKDIKHLKMFLNFKNKKYKQLASRVMIENICTNILEDFYNETTPHTFSKILDDRDDYEKISRIYNFISDVFKMLSKNNDVFSKEDIKVFIDSYINTLYKRTTHPITKYNAIYPYAQAKYTINPNCFHVYMNGMYSFDAKMLLKFSKFLKANNFSLCKIENAFENLKLQYTTCSFGHQGERDEVIYENCKAEFQKLLESKQNKFSTKKKLGKFKNVEQTK